MIRQLLRILWKRRRTNSLVLAEAFIAFLVLFVLTATVVHAARTYYAPLGYGYENMWTIRISTGGPWIGENTDTVRNLLRRAVTLDRVQNAFVLNMAPFENGHWTTSGEFNGEDVRITINESSDDLADIIGLNVIRGRWYGPEDDGVDWRPTVINQMLADRAFPGEDPIGKLLIEREDDDGRAPWKVVGVVDHFRQTGEMDPEIPYAFVRFPPEGDSDGVFSIHVQVSPGTTAAFEEPLSAALRAEAPGWGFSMTPWVTQREGQIKNFLIPLAVFAVVVVSFLFMVALGLLGVLWQNVSQRTSEFGIRRAMGAAAASVRRQVVLELILLVGLGSLLASLFAIQAPWLGVHEIFTWPTTLISLVITLGAMALLSWICAGYPSWMATRIDPAFALHYE